ncbi:MAG: hypothetical protein WA979_05405 [Pacificimonas sp.]
MMSEKNRYLWLLAVAAVMGLLLSAGALYYLSDGSWDLPIHLMIAVTLAATLSMVLAAALMGLIFLSNRSGHDQVAADEAAKHEPDDWV